MLEGKHDEATPPTGSGYVCLGLRPGRTSRPDQVCCKRPLAEMPERKAVADDLPCVLDRHVEVHRRQCHITSDAGTSPWQARSGWLRRQSAGGEHCKSGASGAVIATSTQRRTARHGKTKCARRAGGASQDFQYLDSFLRDLERSLKQHTEVAPSPCDSTSCVSDVFRSADVSHDHGLDSHRSILGIQPFTSVELQSILFNQRRNRQNPHRYLNTSIACWPMVSWPS